MREGVEGSAILRNRHTGTRWENRRQRRGRTRPRGRIRALETRTPLHHHWPYIRHLFYHRRHGFARRGGEKRRRWHFSRDTSREELHRRLQHASVRAAHRRVEDHQQMRQRHSLDCAGDARLGVGEEGHMIEFLWVGWRGRERQGEGKGPAGGDAKGSALDMGSEHCGTIKSSPSPYA